MEWWTPPTRRNCKGYFRWYDVDLSDLKHQKGRRPPLRVGVHPNQTACLLLVNQPMCPTSFGFTGTNQEGFGRRKTGHLYQHPTHRGGCRCGLRLGHPFLCGSRLPYSGCWSLQPRRPERQRPSHSSQGERERRKCRKIKRHSHQEKGRGSRARRAR